ncbi:hypothetical protein P3T27_007279 [Kitasatospora sp. MAA19]|nr:hypothetical protein [Kitasatospora sp. MAA19]
MTTLDLVRGTAARAADAVKIYGVGGTEVRALGHVTVEFPAGRFTAIMGPSGSGTSTLVHCAAGLDTLRRAGCTGRSPPAPPGPGGQDIWACGNTSRSSGSGSPRRLHSRG